MLDMNFMELLQEPDGPLDLLKITEAEDYAIVQELVEEGVLPEDTFIRLDSIGDNVPDPDTPEVSLRRSILYQLVSCAEAPEHLNPFTRNLIFGEPPRAMLVWDIGKDTSRLHTSYQRPFVVKPDLVQVIKERREEEGKTVTEVPDDRRWRHPDLVEEAQCQRIAHGLWRVMAQRIMPEWLKPESLHEFYRPHKKGNTIDVGLDPHIMNRRIVGAVALNISHIYDIYIESTREGVIGIADVGRRDLRTLLADEYPELH
jgi:hypothetical protein